MAVDETPLIRTLLALEAIQDRPGITAAQLAERLGVTERAVRRYVLTLRDAGVPVESSRGPYGGYRLGRGARLPPVSFTEEEAIALVTAVLTTTAGRQGGGDIRRDALDKVIRALPPRTRQQAAVVRDTATSAGRPDPLPHPAATAELVGAIGDQRRVALTYRSESGGQHEWLVDPWALVVRYGRWYLLCHAHHADAVRTLRVDRVEQVHRQPERFDPPADLDPVATLEAALGTGWEHPTHVRFDAPLEQVSRWIGSVSGTLTPVDGGCELRGSTSDVQMYVVERLAQVPFPWRVLGGPELLAATREVAARLAAAAPDGTVAP
ncbi:helix-turn-helix transcriptional regulator [Arsenicicoccus sp. oral taxon 190]|uniref:helix-turn-helix transcriptional regulator n=1 Tax=Arsenicicoccus sp. oral taxon 190 TaxID=1658671 RepID=UPI00067A2E0F|nr:WYL domain-containing protein [Arsenicicoccus sp. oral taxon 190]AKT51004.1 ArsR family transcriptional regulator [Arsenicicoccus sp. oral taxon 190]